MEKKWNTVKFKLYAIKNVETGKIVTASKTGRRYYEKKALAEKALANGYDRYNKKLMVIELECTEVENHV